MPDPSAGAKKVLWNGRPSQYENLGTYVLCALFCWLIVPIFVALWTWLETHYVQYELDEDKLEITKGVFSRRTDVLELYRVRDITVLQPFLLRLFGLGHVVLVTSDASTPKVVLQAIPDLDRVKSLIRDQVEACRQKKRVRQMDVDTF